MFTLLIQIRLSQTIMNTNTSIYKIIQNEFISKYHTTQIHENYVAYNTNTINTPQRIQNHPIRIH